MTILLVLDAQQHQLRTVRKDQSALLLRMNDYLQTHQPLVTGVENRVQHRLVKEEVTHPLRDQNVYLLHWQFHLLHLSVDQRNHILR